MNSFAATDRSDSLHRLNEWCLALHWSFLTAAENGRQVQRHLQRLCFKLLEHDMRVNVTFLRVAECFGQRADYLEAMLLPEPYGALVR